MRKIVRNVTLMFPWCFTKGGNLNPLKPHDASEHHFASPRNDLIPLLSSSSTTNRELGHKFAAVVDENDNGKFRLDSANTEHLYNISITSAQRLRRWSNKVQMLYRCFVFTGERIKPTHFKYPDKWLTYCYCTATFLHLCAISYCVLYCELIITE